MQGYNPKWVKAWVSIFVSHHRLQTPIDLPWHCQTQKQRWEREIAMICMVLPCSVAPQNHQASPKTSQFPTTRPRLHGLQAVCMDHLHVHPYRLDIFTLHHLSQWPTRLTTFLNLFWTDAYLVYVCISFFFGVCVYN